MRVTRREAMGRIGRAAAGVFIFSAASMAPRRSWGHPGHNLGPRPIYPQGVASGDPTPDSVVLWTRAVPLGSDPLGVSDVPMGVHVQVAKDPRGRTPVLDRVLKVEPENDHTVRVVVNRLEPDTEYWFRFMGGGSVGSPIGRTRTAPDPDSPRPVRFAWMSCQKYEKNYFGCWARMVTQDLQRPPEERLGFVVTLGDFIYTMVNPEGWLNRGDPTTRMNRDGTPRVVPPYPDGEGPTFNGGESWFAKSLADYRHMYKLYLTDPDLQRARAHVPFLNVWDDGEWEANPHWLYPPPCRYRPSQDRRVHAARAWFEYMPGRFDDLPETVEGVGQIAREFEPVRVPREPEIVTDPGRKWRADWCESNESLKMPRSIRWGKTLEVVLTDNRSYWPCRYGDDLNPADLGLPVWTNELIKVMEQGREANGGNPPEFLEVRATGKRVPNPRRHAPPHTVLGDEQKAWLKATLAGSTATWKCWASPTPAFPMRIDLDRMAVFRIGKVVPTAECWPGNPGELREIMSHLRDAGVSNAFMVSGHNHMHTAARLCVDPDADEPEPIMLEFNAAALSNGPTGNHANDVPKGFPIRPALEYLRPDGTRADNFHVLLMHGVRSALRLAETDDWEEAMRHRNPRSNPFIDFIDTSMNGWAEARADEQGLEVTHYAVKPGDLRTDWGEEGPPLAYSATLRSRAWSAGEAPGLEGPQFVGEGPLPWPWSMLG